MDKCDNYVEYDVVGYFLHKKTAEKVVEKIRKGLKNRCYEVCIDEIEVNEE
ncbi:hypothetical protein [Anoxybacillus kestanbolensis]